MQIAVERWFKSILVRHSRRKYVNREIDASTLNKIKDTIEELNSNAQGVRLDLVNGGFNQVFKGIIGSYGKITGAPAYVAMIGDSQGERIPEKIGYIGEEFILEATALGLGTCWVAGMFNSKKVEEDVNLKENESVYTITPIGYVEEKYSLGEKMMSKMTSSHKRKDLNELCCGNFNKEWPTWIKTAINSARLAPSAVNAQPWRFEVKEDSIVLLADSSKNSTKIIKKIDFGIAMLHLEIGALHEGVKGSWRYLDASNIAEFKIHKENE